MKDFLVNKAFWMAVLAGIGALSVAFGKPALGAVLSNPETAAQITGVLSTVAALAAAFLNPPSAAPKA
jgi:hypothetical protein